MRRLATAPNDLTNQQPKRNTTMKTKNTPKLDLLEFAGQLIYNNAEAAINLLTKVQRTVARGLDVAQSDPQRGRRILLRAATDIRDIALAILKDPQSNPQTKSGGRAKA